MTDWEIDGFKTHKWLETKEYLMEYTLQEYPKLYSEENKHELCQNLEEGYKKGYTYEISILQYALAKQSAVKNRRLFNRTSKQKGYLLVAFIHSTIS